MHAAMTYPESSLVKVAATTGAGKIAANKMVATMKNYFTYFNLSLVALVVVFIKTK